MNAYSISQIRALKRVRKHQAVRKYQIETEHTENNE